MNINLIIHLLGSIFSLKKKKKDKMQSKEATID